MKEGKSGRFRCHDFLQIQIEPLQDSVNLGILRVREEACKDHMEAFNVLEVLH
jgi:hypothetical protein